MKDDPGERQYTTFLRSANSFEEFAKAEKIVQETRLTWKEAYDACQEFNKKRTQDQIDAGTKMEFTSDDI